ncbi:MAG: ABC transporter permease [Alphaproteobacteria bacterium]
MTDPMQRGPGEWAFRAVCTLVLVFLMFPTVLIVPMSFSPTSFLDFPPRGFSLQWYRAYLDDPAWIDATLFSLQIAAATTVASSIVGTMGAVALVRGRLPGRETIEALLLAPLIVPHIIVAIAVYAQFAPLGLTGTFAGFVLIHTALAVPYVVVVVSAALRRMPPSLEMAGLNLGASRLRCFAEITLPLIAPAVAAGAVFAFLASFDETVVSFFISGVEHKTVTRKLMEDIEFNLSPVIAAASTIFVVSTVLLMWMADLTRRRGRRATA